MNQYELYDDNNLNHVINGPDYGQSYKNDINNLAWSIENSIEFKYYSKYSNNEFFIEPMIYIDFD